MMSIDRFLKQLVLCTVVCPLILICGCLHVAYVLPMLFDPVGKSGDLVRSYGVSFAQLAAPFDGPEDYNENVLYRGEGSLGGLAFGETSEGLRLYVASGEGLQIHDGFVINRLLATVVVPNCRLMGDVVVLDIGSIIVSCSDQAGLLKIDPDALSIEETFSCCEGVGEPFHPVAIALAPDGSILAGTTDINLFDSESGAFIGVAVEAGVLGATSYDDFVWSSDGRLFVSANPDIGILVFDGSTFEFIELFIPGGDEGVPFPKALAFDEDGALFVGSAQGNRLRKFDGQTGDLITEVIPNDDPHSVLSFMAFRP